MWGSLRWGATLLDVYRHVGDREANDGVDVEVAKKSAEVDGVAESCPKKFSEDGELETVQTQIALKSRACRDFCHG